MLLSAAATPLKTLGQLLSPRPTSQQTCLLRCEHMQLLFYSVWKPHTATTVSHLSWRGSLECSGLAGHSSPAVIFKLPPALLQLPQGFLDSLLIHLRHMPTLLQLPPGVGCHLRSKQG